MSFMGMKLLSHLMKLLHLMTLPSQQFYLCGNLFNVYYILIKHALRLALLSPPRLRIYILHHFTISHINKLQPNLFYIQ